MYKTNNLCTINVNTIRALIYNLGYTVMVYKDNGITLIWILIIQ